MLKNFNGLSLCLLLYGIFISLVAWGFCRISNKALARNEKLEHSVYALMVKHEGWHWIGPGEIYAAPTPPIPPGGPRR